MEMPRTSCRRCSSPSCRNTSESCIKSQRNTVRYNNPFGRKQGELRTSMSNIVILGAQWGDEGKGKLVDLLADGFDYIIRYQGGHNAGHTILIGDRKFILRLVPSGILHPGKTAVMGNGLVIDPLALDEEVAQLATAGVDV